MQYTEENYRNAKNNDVFEFECQQCHKIFTKTKRQINKNSNQIPKFCSIRCMHNSRNMGTIIVKCAECGKEKEITLSVYEKSLRKGQTNFFCNKSGAGKFNNKKFVKRTKEEELTTCPVCGGYKDYSSKICNKCRKKEREEFVSNQELGYYIGYDKKAKYVTGRCTEIRKNARDIMLKNKDVEQNCAYCHNHEYDDILEVHHIKSILTFDPHTKVKEINAKENLIWLCPNHHRMLERGLISLDDNNNGALV